MRSFDFYRMCDRTMTRDEWTHLYRVVRKVGERPEIHDPLAYRAELASHIAECTNDWGYVGIVSSGRDCDHVYSLTAREYKGMTVVKFCQMEDEMYRWAEGPCSMSICHVEDMPEPEYRDYIAEAHEDGHPWSVAR